MSEDTRKHPPGPQIAAEPMCGCGRAMTHAATSTRTEWWTCGWCRTAEPVRRDA